VPLARRKRDQLELERCTTAQNEPVRPIWLLVHIASRAAELIFCCPQPPCKRVWQDGGHEENARNYPSGFPGFTTPPAVHHATQLATLLRPLPSLILLTTESNCFAFLDERLGVDRRTECRARTCRPACCVHDHSTPVMAQPTRAAHWTKRFLFIRTHERPGSKPTSSSAGLAETLCSGHCAPVRKSRWVRDPKRSVTDRCRSSTVCRNDTATDMIVRSHKLY
jgi:hypothetical protein